MNAQPQLRSNSAKAPQRWLPILESDDEVRIEEHEKHCKENKEHCTMCLKDKPGLVLLDCGHRYCNGCLDHHIRLMLRQEDFAPRCCGQAISVYKYSDVLSHAVLARYLQARIRKARQGAIRCAGSECTDRRSTISQYLIEDEWGLCEKCHKVTCARCCRLRIHHEGDREARVCPTTIKLTATNPATVDLATEAPSFKEVLKKMELQKCSKCNELISPTAGHGTMPCPCGAIICLRCAGAHRKTQSLIPFGCWCRAMAQPQTRSAVSERVSGLLHPPTSAPDTPAAPGHVRARVDSDHENQLPPIVARPQQQHPQQQPLPQQLMQRQQRVHRGRIQGLINPQDTNRGLITSASFPTPDGVTHALNGKENGLTRNQISQALSCSVEFLNKILGQMLNANLIWVLNTNDETRYGLRRAPQPCADDTSASSVVYYGMLHQNSHPQLDVRRPLSDQTSAGSHQTFTALDISAGVCHDCLEEGGLPRA